MSMREIPPDAYREELRNLMIKSWPEIDLDLLEHLASVVIAFDTATCFAMSFRIAKFPLAQEETTLVGEIVGRHGRKTNPAIVRAIENWPPI
jgi:hypothetical protein